MFNFGRKSTNTNISILPVYTDHQVPRKGLVRDKFKKPEKAVILVIAENSDALPYQQLDHRKINVALVLKKLKEAGLVESTSNR